MEVSRSFPISLYLRSQKGEAKSIYGDPLYERQFERIADAKNFVDEYDGVTGMEIYGQTDWVQQFIAYHYPQEPGKLEFNIKDFRVVSIDLEVAHDDGFPEPAEAAEEIISINYKVFGGRSYAFGFHEKPNIDELSGVEYIKCIDERDLLTKFVDFFRTDAPHIFTGWNAYGFDVPYLVNRVNNVLGEKSADRLSPFHGMSGIKGYISKTYNKEGVDSFKILGVTVLDFLELYKKFHPEKRESYRLDYIGEIECKTSKVDYSEYGNSLMRLYRGEWHVAADKDPSTLSVKDRWCRVRGIIRGELLRRGIEHVDADEHLVAAPCDLSGIETQVHEVVDWNDDDLWEIYTEVDGHVKSLSFGQFLHYNAVDNDLVEMLDAKLQYVQLGVAIAMLTKSRIADCMGTVRIWDNLIYHMALQDEAVIPPKVRQFDSEKAGGFVRDTVPGRYRWPVTFDLTSLYPSIARLLNMSPETQLSEPMGGQEMVDRFLSGELRPEDYTSDGVCFAFNGVTFDTTRPGIVARAMSFVFYERKRYKNLMKDVKRQSESAKAEGASLSQIAEFDAEMSKWDAFQKAVKVVNNGGYGALGNPNFRYFRPAISDAITVTGQYVIRFIAERLNWYMNDVLKTTDVEYVIGSDTDSVMLTLAGFVDKIDPEGKVPTSKMVDAVNQFCEKGIEKFLEDEYAKLAESLNAIENTLDMKREAICDVGLFRAKKNYAMRVWDMEHVRYAEPQMKIAGLESQRTDKPIPCREMMRDLIPVFFDGTEAELQKKVSDFKELFLKMPIDKIAFPKGVSDVVKWTGPDGNVDPMQKSVPIHSRAAVVYNYLLKNRPELSGIHPVIKNKSKIKFVYLKPQNPIGSHVVGFLSELPEEFGLRKYIDLESQFEKSFLNPIQSLATLVGWSAEKRAKLDDLFE